MDLTSPAVARRLGAVLGAALLVVGAVALAAPAEAQMLNNTAGARRTGGGSAQQEQKAEPATPALPGAHPAAPVAPATRPALDMAPTEALFDAINRGDLAAARDAINRGADLNGKNVLGETPLELSVDLGRNDISFLLLSMRRVIGADGVEQAAVSPGPALPAPRGRRHDRRLRAEELQTTPAAASAPLPVSGGTPVPAAGFLGFDFGRQSNLR